MARAALGRRVRAPAETAGVTPNTISRIENGSDALGQTPARVQKALEEGGVVFVEPNGLGPGVRMRER